MSVERDSRTTSEREARKAERRQRIYRWRASPVLLTLIIGVVAAAGAFTGLSLHWEADNSRRTQVELATLLEHAHQLGGHLEQEAVAREAARPALREEINATRRDTVRMLGSLERAHPGDVMLGEITRTYTQYSSAMTDELRLLAAGRKAEAEKLHAERVDPLSSKLTVAIRRDVETQKQLAVEKTRVADYGTSLMTVVAFAGVALLLRGFDRARQAVIAAETEKRVTAQSEERFRQVAESAGEWIWEVDADGLYTYCSPAVETILGYEPEEIVGKKHFYDLFAPDVREELKKAALGAFSAKEALKGFPNPNLHKNGGIVILETSGTPILDEQGRLIGYRGADADVTERKQAEQLKSDVVAMVSHDLRSPLAAIAGNATLLERLLEKTPGPEQALTAARKIRERAESTAQMASRMLDVSQIEAGTFALTLDTVDVGDVVARAAESVPLTETHTLEVDLAPDLPPVRCDPERLSMVVTNLMANAVKFSPRGGKIGVAVRQEEERTLVSVSDRGMGIMPEDRSHIFERFGRGGAEAVRSVSGAGIGLYLSRKIVEAHGGTIAVESEPGKGSTFTIDIPLIQERPASGPLESVA